MPKVEYVKVHNRHVVNSDYYYNQCGGDTSCTSLETGIQVFKLDKTDKEITMNLDLIESIYDFKVELVKGRKVVESKKEYNDSANEIKIICPENCNSYDELLFYTKVTVANSDGEGVSDKFEQSFTMDLKDIE